MEEETYFVNDYLDRYLTEQEAAEVVRIQKAFLERYTKYGNKMKEEEWLSDELLEQLPSYPKEEIKKISQEIIASLKITETKKKEQNKAIAAGRSKESWLASSILKSSSYQETQNKAEYLRNLDRAVGDANQAMHDTITTKAGVPNQNMNLDGFIAEQQHVNSYNLKAEAVGGDLYAEVLKPKAGETYPKNSVDIVLKDKASGKIVQRYQAKYGATAKDTIRMIKEGDYRGQRLLVPEEQVAEVQKAFPNRKVSAVIGEGGITSKPLTKWYVKKLQNDAQREMWNNSDWNEFQAKDLAIGIGKQAGYACLQGAAVGAGLNVLSKVWNGEKVEGEELIETAITSGADFGVKSATAGALKAASEKGIIKAIPKGTSAGTFASIAFAAIENVKIVGKIMSGQLTAKEGIESMQQATGSMIAGIVASAKASAIGATIGTVLGPVGSAIGGFVGGTVGYMAGSKFGQTIVKGAQKVAEGAKNIVKSIGEAAGNTFRKIGSGILSFFGC